MMAGILGRDRLDSRLVAVDFWKSVAIFGVVWIHCSYIVPHAPTYIDWTSPLFLFCVPVFIAFWAHFAEKSARKPSWTYRGSLGRSLRLLVPFLVWSLAYWILKGDFGGGAVHQITAYWSGYGWPGQYFFVILLQLILVFPWLRRLARRVPFWANLGATLALLAAFAGFPEPATSLVKLGDRPFVYWIPYVVLGIHTVDRKIPRVPIWLVLGAIVLIPLDVKFLDSRIASVGPYLRPSVFLASVLIVLSAFGDAAKPGPSTRFQDIAGWISNNSLAIFCLNPLFLWLVPLAWNGHPPVAFPGAGWVVPPVAIVAVVAGCLGLAWSIRRLGLSRLVANG